MLGISLAAGAATLLETTIEIAASPVSYVYDLTLAHDITVNILHDSNNDKFPTVATHYKVTAQFDRGATPYTQTLPMPPGTVKTLPPVAFQNVPFGGNVTVTVGFYSERRLAGGPGLDGVGCQRRGHRCPTSSSTSTRRRSSRLRCTSTSRSPSLTDAQGTHGWLVSPTGPTTKADSLVCEQAAGDLCSLRDITVRQGTRRRPRLRRLCVPELQHRRQRLRLGAARASSTSSSTWATSIPPADTSPRAAGFQSGIRLTYSLFPGLDAGRRPDARQLGLLPRHDERRRAPRAAGPEPAAVRSPEQ